MEYKVRILRRDDKKVVLSATQGNWEGEDGDWSRWATGNYSCDCNRELSFRRALGEDPELDEVECGEGKFLVVAFIFADGTTLEGPDAAEVRRLLNEENQNPGWAGASD